MTSLAFPYRLTKFPSFAFPRLNQNLILGLELAFIVFLTSLCLWQNNQFVARTYQSQNLQLKVAGLKKENESLEMNSLRENSLSNLEILVRDLGLEKTGEVTFIRSPGTIMVAR
ncbi:MAG: hypothetical protein Q8N16_01265 [bacterium]|nr:hypothetical protein [bacterium]